MRQFASRLILSICAVDLECEGLVVSTNRTDLTFGRNRHVVESSAPYRQIMASLPLVMAGAGAAGDAFTIFGLADPGPNAESLCRGEFFRRRRERVSRRRRGRRCGRQRSGNASAVSPVAARIYSRR